MEYDEETVADLGFDEDNENTAEEEADVGLSEQIKVIFNFLSLDKREK